MFLSTRSCRWKCGGDGEEVALPEVNFRKKMFAISSVVSKACWAIKSVIYHWHSCRLVDLPFLGLTSRRIFFIILIFAIASFGIKMISMTCFVILNWWKFTFVKDDPHLKIPLDDFDSLQVFPTWLLMMLTALNTCISIII